MGNCVGSKGIKKDPKLLTEEEIKLLLDNTRLTRPQIVALHGNFLKECPSGKLTKKDFIKLFKEVHPSENKKEKADKFCEYVFKVIDTNNLGYISFQDFVLCFSLTSDGDFRQKCEFAFKLYDLDKDGKISKKEMTQVLTALYDLSGITDRKKNNAPAKKVEDIMRKINLTYQPPAGAAAAAPAAASSADEKKAAKKAEKEKKEREAKEKKEAEKARKEQETAEKKGFHVKSAAAATKEEKKPKPAKSSSAKAPEYITKEQFIDACSSDETLKKLFVDSIFCNQGDCSDATNTALNNLNNNINNNTAVNITVESPSKSSLRFTAPSLSLDANAGSFEFKAPSVEVLGQPAPTTVAAAEPEPEQAAPVTAVAADIQGQYNIREENNFEATYKVSSPLIEAPLLSVSLNSGEAPAAPASAEDEEKKAEPQQA